MSRSLFIESKISVLDNVTSFSQIILDRLSEDWLQVNLLINYINDIYLRDHFAYSVEGGPIKCDSLDKLCLCGLFFSRISTLITT